MSIGSPCFTLSRQCLCRSIPASGSIGAPASLAVFAMSSFGMFFTFPVLFAFRVYVYFAGWRLLGILPPCASTILVIAPYAAPVVSSLFAVACPWPFRALPLYSSNTPAIQMLFLTRSCGAHSLHFKLHMTSRASSIGPMPLPIGCDPSVIVVLTFMPRRLPSSEKCLLRCLACFLSFTFVPGPIGISINRWVVPTLAFFAMMLASICPSASMLSGCSILMILSSAGARLTLPPQMMNPPTSWMTFLSLFIGRLTGQRTSIVSAVPAGEVIALLLVFGTMQPAATRIGTISIVVLLPGTPPMLCTSITGYLLKWSVCPVLAIAFVRAAISCMFIPRV